MEERKEKILKLFEYVRVGNVCYLEILHMRIYHRVGTIVCLFDKFMLGGK